MTVVFSGFLRRRLQARGEQSGSLSVELVMVAPGMLMILALIFAYGRVTQVRGALEAGTRDAARVATQARSYDQAKVDARQTLLEALQRTPDGCRNSAEIKISNDFVAGGYLTVTGTCEFSLADIGLIGAPGSVKSTSSFVSRLDRYREIQ